MRRISTAYAARVNKMEKNTYILYTCIAVLVIWNIYLTIDITHEEPIVEAPQVTFESLINSSDYYWNCNAWFGYCNELTFVNETGYYILRGYVDEGCEDMCKTYTLYKKRHLETLVMPDPEACAADSSQCEIKKK